MSESPSRSPGRPRGKSTNARTRPTYIAMPPRVRTRIDDIADRAGRKVSDVALSAIERSLRDKEWLDELLAPLPELPTTKETPAP